MCVYNSLDKLPDTGYVFLPKKKKKKALVIILLILLYVSTKSLDKKWALSFQVPLCNHSNIKAFSSKEVRTSLCLQIIFWEIHVGQSKGNIALYQI